MPSPRCEDKFGAIAAPLQGRQPRPRGESDVVLVSPAQLARSVMDRWSTQGFGRDRRARQRKGIRRSPCDNEHHSASVAALSTAAC
jgi:hypothetical protein